MLLFQKKTKTLMIGPVNGAQIRIHLNAINFECKIVAVSLRLHVASDNPLAHIRLWIRSCMNPAMVDAETITVLTLRRLKGCTKRNRMQKYILVKKIKRGSYTKI